MPRSARATFASAGARGAHRAAPRPRARAAWRARGRRGEPFDLVFIDADKVNNPHYLDWAVKLGRPGTVIITDNVIRDGEILDSASRDEDIVGTRALFDRLSSQPRLSATAIQTVGGKGWDGFAFAIVD